MRLRKWAISKCKTLMRWYERSDWKQKARLVSWQGVSEQLHLVNWFKVLNESNKIKVFWPKNVSILCLPAHLRSNQFPIELLIFSKPDLAKRQFCPLHHETGTKDSHFPHVDIDLVKNKPRKFLKYTRKCRKMTHNRVAVKRGWEQGWWEIWGRDAQLIQYPRTRHLCPNIFVLSESKHHSLSAVYPMVALKRNPPEIGRLESSLSLLCFGGECYWLRGILFKCQLGKSTMVVRAPDRFDNLWASRNGESEMITFR